MTISPGTPELPNPAQQHTDEPQDRYGLQQLAKASIRTVALKRDNTFLVADVRGDLQLPQQEMGLFWHDTRYLHALDLLIEGLPLIGLAYSAAETGDLCHIDLCNPFVQVEAEGVAQGTLHVRRTVEIHEQQLAQHLTLTSYHPYPLQVRFGVQAAADFRDLFEIRGLARSERGMELAPVVEPHALTFRYQGRDAIVRSTQIAVSPAADDVTLDGLIWYLTLRPGELVQLQITVNLQETPLSSRAARAQPARVQAAPHQAESALLTMPEIASNNVFFNRLLIRSMHDLEMMCGETSDGLYPYGGIPWYVCPFGRDGLITSLEFLPWFPEVARGTLAFLARYQGTKIDDFTEEEPGRILHEYRRGEMANCHEIPFVPYYGTIDATPLFIITLESYVRWTNDVEFLREIWPNAQAAAHWMQQYGDRDGDTFLEYGSVSNKGLSNQGWKDSWDAVSYADGKLAVGPIALCEVQGYAFAAYEAMHYLAGRMGLPDEAARWHAEAQQLRTNFWRAFWWEAEQTLYLALDGKKRPCEVVSSNAGQCLWSGIVPSDYAEAIVHRLLRDDMYTDWGVRTLSARAARYNPMSYHNGSVWPHDTALVGAGFARYGFKREAGRLLADIFAVSLHFERARLPELLCGFPRRQGYGPTPYPVACAPQSWAAGAPFLLLSALLGLQADAEYGSLVAYKPYLPEFLHDLAINELRLGGAAVGLHCLRSSRIGALSLTGSGPVDLHVIGRS